MKCVYVIRFAVGRVTSHRPLDEPRQKCLWKFSDHYVKRCDFEWFWATIFGVKQVPNGIAGAPSFTIKHGSLAFCNRDQHNMLWRFYCWSCHEPRNKQKKTHQEEVWCDSALHWVFGWWKLLHAKPWTVNKIKTKISSKTIKRKLNVGSGDSIPSFAPLKPLSLSSSFFASLWGLWCTRY